MSRSSWIMFGMITIVVISVLLVALLILVPQNQPITTGNVNEYEKIAESEYSYTQSKDISEEAMKETYSVTTEDIQEGKASKLYKQGNTDPFSTPEKASESSGNKKPAGGGSTVNPYSADDK